jgi:hypothetical protein
MFLTLRVNEPRVERATQGNAEPSEYRVPGWRLAVLGSAVVPVCASCARTVKSFVLETKVLIVSFKYVITAFNSVNFLIKTPSLGIDWNFLKEEHMHQAHTQGFKD